MAEQVYEEKQGSNHFSVACHTRYHGSLNALAVELEIETVCFGSKLEVIYSARKMQHVLVAQSNIGKDIHHIC